MFRCFTLILVSFFYFNAHADINVFPLSVDFGRVDVNDDATRYVQVNNWSTNQVDQLYVWSIYDGNFDTFSTCPTIMPASGGCTIRVRFSPRTEGHYLTTLRITWEWGGQQTVFVRGEGVEGNF